LNLQNFNFFIWELLTHLQMASAQSLNIQLFNVNDIETNPVTDVFAKDNTDC